MKTFKQHLNEKVEFDEAYGLVKIGKRVNPRIPQHSPGQIIHVASKKEIEKMLKNLKKLGGDGYIMQGVTMKVGDKVKGMGEEYTTEKVEYYLDISKDDTEKYVAFDGGTWYTGRVGMKGGDSFLKFVATHGKNSYFEKAKLKKTTPKELEKDATEPEWSMLRIVDFKKLYKR